MGTPGQARPPIIRNYQSSDWDAIYDVCVRTGHRGQDASAIFQEPRLVPDVFAGPYLCLEPDLCFVLDDGERPVGYVIGTAGTAKFVEAYREEWLPRMAGRYPAPDGPPFATRDDLFLHLMYHPERMLVPEVLPDYPAHLHIDVLPAYQANGFGRRLIDTFCAAAGRAGAPGAHVAVDRLNHPAHGFYRKVGFKQVEVAADREEVAYYGRVITIGA